MIWLEKVMIFRLLKAESSDLVKKKLNITHKFVKLKNT